MSSSQQFNQSVKQASRRRPYGGIKNLRVPFWRGISSEKTRSQARRRRAFSTENDGFGVSEKVTPSRNLAFSYAFEAWPGEAEKQEKNDSAEWVTNNGPPPWGGLSYSCRASLRAYVMSVSACKIRGRPEFRL